MVDLILVDRDLGVLRNDVAVVSGILGNLRWRADITCSTALNIEIK